MPKLKKYNRGFRNILLILKWKNNYRLGTREQIPLYTKNYFKHIFSHFQYVKIFCLADSINALATPLGGLGFLFKKESKGY